MCACLQLGFGSHRRLMLLFLDQTRDSFRPIRSDLATAALKASSHLLSDFVFFFCSRNDAKSTPMAASSVALDTCIIIV
uniref:Secreted protein n=1 Tax=Panagrellus redivivus TaxID=6233 RepID=A0A7E4V9G8_PANRE